MTTRDAEDAYDRAPYTDHAYAETHPDRLAVIAALSGWKSPPVETARILEIGCGRGGNLLPMAAHLPRATLTGVDASTRQIDEARAIAHATSLANVTFHATRFEDASMPDASFDFVICHGVYSWVSVATRRALLEAVARWLSPAGIAYVSLNTLPGWYERLAARDWIRFAAREGGEAARSALTWLYDCVSPERSGYRRHLGEVSARLRETGDAYLLHEYLASEHRPESVSTFLADAMGGGLSYLGDAVPATVAVELLPERVQQRILGASVDEAQTIIDFVRGTAFRRALLVRADAAREASWTWAPTLDPRPIEGMWWASRLRNEADDLYRGPEGVVMVQNETLRRALSELSSAAPGSLRHAELAARSRVSPEVARDFLRDLADLWLSTGGLDLSTREVQLAVREDLDGRPTACRLARWHATNGGPITNLLHQEVRLEDAAVRFVLERIDGTRTGRDLVKEVLASTFAAEDAAPPAAAVSIVVRSLALLADAGLRLA